MSTAGGRTGSLRAGRDCPHSVWALCMDGTLVTPNTLVARFTRGGVERAERRVHEVQDTCNARAQRQHRQGKRKINTAQAGRAAGRCSRQRPESGGRQLNCADGRPCGG